MTIRNLQAFVDGLWDWGILDGCFGETKIKPADIDGIVERKGQFLVIEAKSRGKEIPYGQRLTYDALRKTGLFTIVIVWGRKNKPESMQLMNYRATFSPRPCTLTEFRQTVSDWFSWADGSKPGGG